MDNPFRKENEEDLYTLMTLYRKLFVDNVDPYYLSGKVIHGNKSAINLWEEAHRKLYPENY